MAGGYLALHLGALLDDGGGPAPRQRVSLRVHGCGRRRAGTRPRCLSSDGRRRRRRRGRRRRRCRLRPLTVAAADGAGAVAGRRARGATRCRSRRGAPDSRLFAGCFRRARLGGGSRGQPATAQADTRRRRRSRLGGGRAARQPGRDGRSSGNPGSRTSLARAIPARAIPARAPVQRQPRKVAHRHGHGGSRTCAATAARTAAAPPAAAPPTPPRPRPPPGSQTATWAAPTQAGSWGGTARVKEGGVREGRRQGGAAQDSEKIPTQSQSS